MQGMQQLADNAPIWAALSASCCMPCMRSSAMICWESSGLTSVPTVA